MFVREEYSVGYNAELIWLWNIALGRCANIKSTIILIIPFTYYLFPVLVVQLFYANEGVTQFFTRYPLLYQGDNLDNYI